MNIFTLIFYIRHFNGIDVGLNLIQWALILSGIFVMISLVVSLGGIGKHLIRYTDPHIQRYLVRIILMMPIYAINSFLSIIFHEYALYLTLARDCYEAYVLYIFFMLIRNLLGGERNLQYILERKPPFPHPFPLTFITARPGSLFLHRTKQMLAQFVILLPICQLLAIICVFFGVYEEGSFSPKHGYVYIAFVNNVSITLALYWLVLFYTSLKEDLQPYRALSKFLCIKIILFFAFWQDIVISLLASLGLFPEAGGWSEEDITRALSDFLICFECLPLSFAFNHAFGVGSMLVPALEPYFPGSNNLNLKNKNNISDSQKKKNKNNKNSDDNNKQVIRNMADIVNVRDVFEDTVGSFAHGALKYVVVADFLSLSKEEQLDRVVHRGYMLKKATGWRGKVTFGGGGGWQLRYFVLISQPLGLLYYRTNPFDDFDDFENSENILEKIKNEEIIDDVHEIKSDLKEADLHDPEKGENLGSPSGFVDFSSVINIYDNSHPRRWYLCCGEVRWKINVVTWQRVWKFMCEDKDELSKWLMAMLTIWTEWIESTKDQTVLETWEWEDFDNDNILQLEGEIMDDVDLDMNDDDVVNEEGSSSNNNNNIYTTYEKEGIISDDEEDADDIDFGDLIFLDKQN